MLTADLVLARIYKGDVKPRYIDAEDPDKLALAEALIAIFGGHEGRPRHELDAELEELVGTGTDFLLHRALAKLLFDRCTFDTESKVEPEKLRQTVFETAADAYRRPVAAKAHSEGEQHIFHFDRDGVLTAAAAALAEGEDVEVTPADVERGLYADLKDEQLLQEWKPCRPRWLLERYNVALAQGVLLRASELTIRLGKQPPRRQRELFRKIKFFQLLHRVESDGKGGWTIHLDGPMSLFKASGKYGVRMASFLPTLLRGSRGGGAPRCGGRRRRRGRAPPAAGRCRRDDARRTRRGGRLRRRRDGRRARGTLCRTIPCTRPSGVELIGVCRLKVGPAARRGPTSSADRGRDARKASATLAEVW